MVLLYLRGLLKPDYPQGARSVVREEMLLQALAIEVSAIEQSKELEIQAAFAGLFSGRHASELFRTMTQSSGRIAKMRMLDIGNQSKDRGYVDSMTKLYTELVKKGIIVEHTDDAA